MSGVWFLVRQSTPVMVPASCGVYSGAEPSAFSGSDEMLRSGVSARPAGAVCAAACETASPETEANAPADNCMDSRRVICMGRPPPRRRLLECGSVVEERLAHFAAGGPADWTPDLCPPDRCSHRRGRFGIDPVG